MDKNDLFAKNERNFDNYDGFLSVMQSEFLGNTGSKLFKTDTTGLWEIYLNNLPEGKQHYNCSTCRHFINHFGGLVTISDKGNTKSALWNEKDVPDFFKKSVKLMREFVESKEVTGVFISSVKQLGTANTGVWNHFNVILPHSYLYNSRIKTAGQYSAELSEDFKVLKSGLAEYNHDTINKVVALLKSESVYRADRFIGIAEWFEKLHTDIESHRKNTDNIIWKYTANAPTGFAHIKNSAIGTLLEDLKSGYSVQSATQRFTGVVNPANYQRAQVNPSQGNIERAEDVVNKLGIANSLKRRFAMMNEIPEFLWKDRNVKQEVKSGIFSNIPVKEKSKSPEFNLPSTTMTWEKFNRTVLPTADSIEVLVDNPNKFFALVTASDETSENILQWNNRFSWYYHGGIDSEIKKRVVNAGGRYDNNEIRCSLLWDGPTDLDLHCILDNKVAWGRDSHIYFANKMVGYGWLDVDANGGRITSYEPVENIRWENGRAHTGHYKFYVHNYAQRGPSPVPYKVELEINNKVYVYNGIAYSSHNQTVFEFDYYRGREVSVSGNVLSESNWNVQVNSFVKANGITTSPNLWGNDPVERIGKHIFFILDNCKDLSEGKGRGFFAETLKSDLREIRKTLDAYTANSIIESVDNPVCGVGYSNQGEWNLTLKVHSGGTERIIKIDRMD